MGFGVLRVMKVAETLISDLLFFNSKSLKCSYDYRCAFIHINEFVLFITSIQLHLL